MKGKYKAAIALLLALVLLPLALLLTLTHCAHAGRYLATGGNPNLT
jgi:drug/metabolite transporter superfamily protein YnfA